MLVNAQDGIEVIATASNGTEALEKARALEPDVCLLDIRMPGLDGIEVTRQLAGPDCAVGSGSLRRGVGLEKHADVAHRDPDLPFVLLPRIDADLGIRCQQR